MNTNVYGEGAGHTQKSVRHKGLRCMYISAPALCLTLVWMMLIHSQQQDASRLQRINACANAATHQCSAHSLTAQQGAHTPVLLLCVAVMEMMLIHSQQQGGSRLQHVNAITCSCSAHSLTAK